MVVEFAVEDPGLAARITDLRQDAGAEEASGTVRNLRKCGRILSAWAQIG